MSTISSETCARMSRSASRRVYVRVPCAGHNCRHTVTKRAKSGKCKFCLTRAWKKANPKRVNAHNRRYNARKPEVMRGARRLYLVKNPGYTADARAVRRARKQGQFVEKVYRSKALRLHGGMCGVCHTPVDPTDFHVDHVIPLARGGEHSYANTQPAHPLCNLRKAAKIEYEAEGMAA